MERVILHSDLNNFYASVECLYNPELRDKPVAVCGSQSTRHGIVLAKNGIAKSFGVKAGEAIWEAKGKCPGLVVVKPNYMQYLKFSMLTRDIYRHYTDRIEAFGIDENWLDVTESTKLFGSGEKIAYSALHDDGTVSVTDGTNTLGQSGGIENIIGGQGTNLFVFDNNGYFDGYIVGGTGATTLDYSAYTTAITVDLSSMDALTSKGEVNVGKATGVKGINKIAGVIGSSAAGDKLTGPLSANTWNIDGMNAGTVNGSFSFAAIENLVGSADYIDSFVITATGGVSGTLSGNPYGLASAVDTLQIDSGSFAQVTYTVSGQDSGTIKRDGASLNYTGIESVVDLSTAAARTFTYATDKTTNVTLSGTPSTGQIWSLIVDGAAYTHTVTTAQDLTDIANGLAVKLVAAGYLANVQDNGIAITKPAAGALTVTSTLPTGCFAAIETTAAADSGITLQRGDAGILIISSRTNMFGTFSFVDPAGSLAIQAGGGNDTISIGQFISPASVSIDGQAGTDSIFYEVQADGYGTGHILWLQLRRSKREHGLYLFKQREGKEPCHKRHGWS